VQQTPPPAAGHRTMPPGCGRGRRAGGVRPQAV